MSVSTTQRLGARPKPKRRLPVRGSGGSSIDVRLVARSIAQAVVEVLAGTRPIQQLAVSLSDDCYFSLQHRAALTREHAAKSRASQRIHLSPMVRSVRVCSISDTICEASVVVAEEQRCRALAIRLELIHDVWQVTALEIG